MKATMTDYHKFVEYCKEEVEAWHLTGWAFRFKLEDDASQTWLATTSVDDAGMEITIIFNLDWGGFPPTDRALRQTAQHEVMDALLTPLVISIPRSMGIKNGSIPDEHWAVAVSALHRVGHIITQRITPDLLLDYYDTRNEDAWVEMDEKMHDVPTRS